MLVRNLFAALVLALLVAGYVAYETQDRPSPIDAGSIDFPATR